MRYALFDNSTLTAVQRILGGIPLRNYYVIDSDILALESYIQAILFYDTLVYIDDYKEYFRESRRSFFSDMHAHTPSNNAYDDLLEEAQNLTESIIPRVEAGQITDGDFRPFFELLKMNITFTWDMSSSVYYLTVKMLESIGGLDQDKYSKLFSMIRQELTDQRVASTEIVQSKPLLFDSQGQKVTFNNDYKDLAPETDAFFAGLNWLAFRTCFYTLAAKELEMDLFLYPIRHSFQVNSLSKIGIFEEATYRDLINTLSGKSAETVNKILSSTKPFITKHNLPMFTAWLALETGNPQDFIKTAYELRKTDAFVQARQQLIELEDLIAGKNPSFLKRVNQLISDVEKEMNSICVKYGVNTPQGVPISPVISLWNASTLLTRLPQIPDINVNLPIPEPIRNLRSPQGFKAVYRNLVDDLTRIERLGKIHDIIISRIVYHEEAAHYGLKVEPQRYHRKEAYWKKLM